MNNMFSFQAGTRITKKHSNRAQIIAMLPSFYVFKLFNVLLILACTVELEYDSSIIKCTVAQVWDVLNNPYFT